MYRSLNFIIEFFVPVTYVENPKVREFCGLETNISTKALRSTIFKLIELVESAISNEMKDTSGSIMHYA